MITIKQIAILAKVSTATVSHVLNETAYVSTELRERVRHVVRELDYRPNHVARSLRTRQSKTVGMIIPNITNPFFPVMVRGVEDVLRRCGYNLIVGNSDYDLAREEEYFRTLCAKGVDGLVLVITPLEAPEYLRRHNTQKIPVVYVDRHYPGLGGDAVLADNMSGSYQAVKHLLDAGHARIGIITGPLQMLMARRRLLGYRRALRDRGLPLIKKLVRQGNWERQSGYDRTVELMNLKRRPSAIFVCNGLMMIGCLRAIREMRIRCPQDVALVSFDDLDSFELTEPRISAVANPGQEMGTVAAQMLVDRLSQSVDGPSRRKILKVELKVRESSAAQPKTVA